MPYWDEFSAVTEPSWFVDIVGTTNSLPFYRSFCAQRTFRSTGGRGTRENIPVPLGTAEPYSTFEGVNALKVRAFLKRFPNSDAMHPDTGHTWDMIKYEYTGNALSGTQVQSYPYLNRYFNVQPALIGGGASLVPLPYTGNLSAYAAQQYSKAAPHPSVFNLAQFLGELREGLPRIAIDTLSKGRFFRGLGSDYLNVQFGWKPFLADLQNLGLALASSTSLLTGFTKPIHRRRMTSPLVSSEAGEGKFGVAFGFNPNIGVQPAALVRDSASALTRVPGLVSPGNNTQLMEATGWWSTRTESKMWYEAEYVLVPKIGFNPDSFLDRLEVLISTDITPSVLWELAPWSWLVDWAIKIGDSIAANEAASSNRLLTNYAYAMEESVVTHGTIAKNFVKRPGSSAETPSFTGSTVAWSAVTTHKRRIRANPYGFNPVQTSITQPEQWAILGALGLSKSGR